MRNEKGIAHDSCILQRAMLYAPPDSHDSLLKLSTGFSTAVFKDYQLTVSNAIINAADTYKNENSGTEYNLIGTN